MSFFVDLVSEDSFYENLTLGVIKLLEDTTCVKNVQLERRVGCDRAALSLWEQKHCCLLSEELRNFYFSTDGFLLTWTLDIAGELFPIGRMEIKNLASIKRHMNSPTSSNEKEERTSTHYCVSNDESKELVMPSFGGSRCKLFELDQSEEYSVFLAYQLQPDQDEPSVWLYSTKLDKWYHLADNFVKYFRIMLVYLGLPLWQQCSVGLQLPSWIEQVYRLVGPHLLNPSTSSDPKLWTASPTNIIDPSIFRDKGHQPLGTVKQKSNSASTPISSATRQSRKKSSSSY